MAENKTPAKTPAAPATPAAKKDKVEMPDLSFLAAVKPTESKLVSMRGRDAAPNPMEAHLLTSAREQERRQSKNKDGHVVTRWYGKALQIPVDAKNAHYVERLLRRAADANDIGVTVQYFLNPTGTEVVIRADLAKLAHNKKVYVTFAAKERTIQERKDKKAEADAAELVELTESDADDFDDDDDAEDE